MSEPLFPEWQFQSFQCFPPHYPARPICFQEAQSHMVVDTCGVSTHWGPPREPSKFLSQRLLTLILQGHTTSPREKPLESFIACIVRNEEVEASQYRVNWGPHTGLGEIRSGVSMLRDDPDSLHYAEGHSVEPKAKWYMARYFILYHLSLFPLLTLGVVTQVIFLTRTLHSPSKQEKKRCAAFWLFKWP